MIGRLNHVAIATSDIKKAATIYRDMLGGKSRRKCRSPIMASPRCSSNFGNTKIELLEPLGENSPIANFLEEKSRTAACIMSATRWKTSMPRATR